MTHDPYDTQANRDATNPVQTEADPFFPRAQPIAANAVFGAYNEWVQVAASNPGVPGGKLSLTTSQGVRYECGGEPFFVAGAQTFSAAVDVLVTRAPRRELLSDSGGREFPGNGAGQTTVADVSFGPVSVGATDWAYLYAGSAGAYGVRVLAAGTIQAGDLLPFGWAGGVPSTRGRYYAVEFSSTGTGGSQNIEIAHDFGGGLYIGPAVSLQRTAPYGHVQVGDDAGVNIAGPAFVVSNYSQQVALGSKRWTLAIRPAAALTAVSGRFVVVRRGF